MILALCWIILKNNLECKMIFLGAKIISPNYHYICVLCLHFFLLAFPILLLVFIKQKHNSLGIGFLTLELRGSGCNTLIERIVQFFLCDYLMKISGRIFVGFLYWKKRAPLNAYTFKNSLVI